MPYKRPSRCRQAFGVKNKIGKTRANRFVHIFQSRIPLPREIVADGDYTNHASVKAAETAGVSFYGSWQESWRATDYDACGRGPAFIASAFPYDAERDIYLCPAGEKLTYFAIYNDANGVRRHAYRPAKSACRSCAYRDQCASKKAPASWRRKIYAHRRTRCDDCVQSQDDDRGGETDL